MSCRTSQRHGVNGQQRRMAGSASCTARSSSTSDIRPPKRIGPPDTPDTRDGAVRRARNPCGRPLWHVNQLIKNRLVRDCEPAGRMPMGRFAKPAEGSWTEHYPELGTGLVSYADSI